MKSIPRLLKRLQIRALDTATLGLPPPTLLLLFLSVKEVHGREGLRGLDPFTRQHLSLKSGILSFYCSWYTVFPPFRTICTWRRKTERIEVVQHSVHRGSDSVVYRKEATISFIRTLVWFDDCHSLKPAVIWNIISYTSLRTSCLCI